MYGYSFNFNHGVLSSGGGGGANPLWDDLLAYYTADNTPNDALGNYNGTLTNGATYGTGIINQGFSFDGVNDYVNLGNNLNFDGATPFSVSVWVYSSSTSTSAQTYFSKVNGSYIGYEMTVNNGTGVRFFLRSTSGYIDLTINGFLQNQWQNIIFTYDGSKDASGVNGYIDGVLRTKNVTKNTLTGLVSTTVNAQISGRQTSSQLFNGLIDEVGIWNRELTPTEVTELYNSGAGKQYPVVTDFLTATGISDSTIVNAINTLTSDLQSYGIWDKLEAIYPFVGGTSNTHSYNLKNATQHQITWSGGVVHDTNGITGNGTDAYGNTGFLPSLFLTNWISMGVYVRNNLAESSYDIGGNNSSTGTFINTRTTSDRLATICVDGTTRNVGSITDSKGFSCVNRTTNIDRQTYKNGVEYSFTNTTGGSSTSPFFILSRSLNSVANGFSSRNLAFAFIGNSLTTTEHTNLNTAVQTFQTTLGRNV